MYESFRNIYKNYLHISNIDVICIHFDITKECNKLKCIILRIIILCELIKLPKIITALVLV
jgi:hypothetical protein